ncbi:MAG: DUF255 domain-containing protein [Myxococcota bacterium]|nr:DUF255 domain-containing protein [Myxococcota bacterium]
MSQNRLHNAQSLYLRQHAHHPVHWYPWCTEAFETARQDNKPILLSIGYAACHWCHVMAHESFENQDIADHLNQHFICIKVDREERPDIDEVYMTVVQALNRGNGGWPMTVILTPDAEPIFGGTYYPPSPRNGMPGFNQILQYAHALYHKDSDKRNRITTKHHQYLKEATALPAAAEQMSPDWFQRITESATKDYDYRYGGFGHMPKFPPHGVLASLLAYAQLTQDKGVKELAFGTLNGMARGGVYDLLGGGFARYSVDEQWRIPHFEKMLSDNAQLISHYLTAYSMTDNAHYRAVAVACLEYAIRELSLPSGGFASSQDADTDGVEGRFYCWSREEALQVLGPEQKALLDTFEITESGTFEENGWSVIRLDPPLSERPEAEQIQIQTAFNKLKSARDLRSPPARDDKFICSWNALLVSALAKAGRILNEPRYVKVAEETLSHIAQQLFTTGKTRSRLLRRPCHDDQPILAFADDYAALINAHIDMAEAQFSLSHLQKALELMDDCVALFWDDTSDDGGFFYTGSDSEQLLVRSKKTTGGAEPSANGLAALALIRLDLIFDRPDLRQKAEQSLRCYQTLIERAPQAVGWEAYAAAWLQYPIQEMVLIRPETQNQAFLDCIHKHHYPFRIQFTATEEQAELAAEVIPLLANRSLVDGQPTAYLCEGRSCQHPTTEVSVLAEQLKTAQKNSHAQLLDHIRPPAPALPHSAEQWVNGLPDSNHNRIRVLYFWTGCSINCQHILPEILSVELAFRAQGVEFIGIHSPKFNQEKEHSSLQHTTQRFGINHPVLMDADHKTWASYEVQAWPSVVIVDSTGKIAYRRNGEVQSIEMMAVCDRLLSELEEPLMPLKPLPKPTPRPNALCYPTKLCMSPSLTKQLQGEDPFALGSRLYVADTGNHQIKVYHLNTDDQGLPRAVHVDTWGSGTAGFHNGALHEASFNRPHGLSCTNQRLYVADTGNHAIRCIDLDSGTVSTLAGSGQLGRGSISDHSNPLKLSLRSPMDLDVINQASSELLIVAMAGAHQLWLYVPETDRMGPFLGSGLESHIDGNNSESALAQPSAVVSVGPYLFFVDAETSSIRIYDFNAKQVGTLVGEGLFDFGDIDGASEMVRMQHPMGITAGRTELFVADCYNHKIKSIELNGAFTRTVYGEIKGQLNEPQGLAKAGKYLLIADTNHHQILCLDPQTGTAHILIE